MQNELKQGIALASPGAVDALMGSQGEVMQPVLQEAGVMAVARQRQVGAEAAEGAGQVGQRQDVGGLFRCRIDPALPCPPIGLAGGDELQFFHGTFMFSRIMLDS